MPPGKQNQSASAQEIAEKLFQELGDHIKQNGSYGWLDDSARSVILSAITAAVVKKDARIKNLTDYIRDWSQCRCNSGGDHQCERCQLLLGGSTAAVAAVEQEPAMFRNLLRRLRDSIDECDSEALLQEVDSALELKEPALDNVNAVLQKARGVFIERFGPMAITAGYGRDIEIYKTTQAKLFRVWQTGVEWALASSSVLPATKATGEENK